MDVHVDGLFSKTRSQHARPVIVECPPPPVPWSSSSSPTSALSMIHYHGRTSTWVQCRCPQSKPPPVEPTGVSNKVDDERRAPKPDGPSRTLQHHESRSRAVLQSCWRIGRFSNRKPRPRRKRLRLSGQVRLWTIRQLGFLNEIQRTFVLDCVT